MHSISSPNLINDDQSLFPAGIAKIFTLSDESSDGSPATVFENPNEKSGGAWRLADTKKPGNKKRPVFPKRTFRFLYFRAWQTA